MALTIGDWTLDEKLNELRRDGTSVRLEPKAIEVLAYLAARASQVVSRDELLDAVWPGVVVGDDTLTQAIIKLRKALGDDAHHPTYIETISKRGYRLVAPVETLGSSAQGDAAAAGRRLAAILSADIAGYSRLMAENDAATVEALKALQVRVLPLIPQSGGRVIDLAGDGILAEFPSAVAAVQTAAAIQRAMAEMNADVPRSRQMQFRIGVNIGDVIHDAKRIYGDGINVAARIQALAPPGGVVVSKAVFDQVRQSLPEHFVALGSGRLKNIRDRVAIYQMELGSGRKRPDWLTRWAFSLRTRPMPVLGTAFALLLAGAIAIAIPVVGTSLRLPYPFGGDAKGSASSALATVAVLPLANLSGDPARDYFSDGMTEDLISALGRFSGLRVISRAAVHPYRGKNPTPQEIRAQLGARYVALGSVREAGDRLRVAVELTDAERGTVLWSDRIEGGGKDIFEIQDRIVQSIAGAVAVKVSRAEHEKAATRPVSSLEAHDLAMRARELLYELERDKNRQARALLSRAVELAPNYAEAYAWLSYAEFMRGDFGWVEDPQASLERSTAYALRALSIDDPGAQARAHAQLARNYSMLGRYDEALTEADRAIAINPSDTVALFARGSLLIWSGKPEEGVAQIELARKYGGTGTYLFDLANAAYMMGRYQHAVSYADAGLAKTPNSIPLRTVRAAALGQLGDANAAADAAAQLRRLSPFFRADLAGLRFKNPEHSARYQEGLRKAGL